MSLFFYLLLLCCWSLPGESYRRNVAVTRAAVTSSVRLSAGGQVPLVPYYPDKARKDYQWMDIYNALGRTRTLFVSRYLDDEACNQLVASLVWLQSQSDKEPVTLYFNVPGAMAKPTLAVFDVMRKMSCPLITINMGLTVGMSCILCAAGSSGKRFAMPNARFLMAKAGLEDGVQGQSAHIALMVKEVMKDNKKYISELSRLCGQPVTKVETDMKRDFYLTATEAAAYGLIDEVMVPAQPIKIMRYRGDDDDVIGFGHFSEVRRVKSGPSDKVVPIKSKFLSFPNSTTRKPLSPANILDTDEDFDEYAAKEMSKKGYNNGRPDPRSLKNGGGVNRFANSRCKPPGLNKPIEKKPPVNGGDDSDNPFKNAGW